MFLEGKYLDLCLNGKINCDTVHSELNAVYV